LSDGARLLKTITSHSDSIHIYERDRKRMPKSDIQMKNKCKIQILKKQFEGITESSINYNKALGSTHFYMFLHQHVRACTHAASFSILSVSTAFIMVIMFFGVDTTSTHQDMMNISFHYF
jgi:hypothetical protein